jgi:hypothetical protein
MSEEITVSSIPVRRKSKPNSSATSALLGASFFVGKYIIRSLKNSQKKTPKTAQKSPKSMNNYNSKPKSIVNIDSGIDKGNQFNKNETLVVKNNIDDKIKLEKIEKKLDDISKETSLPVAIDKTIKETSEDVMKKFNRIMENESFQVITKDITLQEKENLAGAMAVKNTVLEDFVISELTNLKEKTFFKETLKISTRNLALSNFDSVSKVLKDAAKYAGFNKAINILKNANNVLDIIFTDNRNRRMSAYLKINKSLNPSLAIDLEGFNKLNENECGKKMNDIIKYLEKHDVNIDFKKIKHNQPEGVLRKLLNEKERLCKDKEINDYLKSDIINQISQTIINR